jgi:hypothetical protein
MEFVKMALACYAVVVVVVVVVVAALGLLSYSLG